MSRVQVNVSIPGELNEHLRNQLARSRRSLQAEVEIALESHLGLRRAPATSDALYEMTEEEVLEALVHGPRE